MLASTRSVLVAIGLLAIISFPGCGQSGTAYGVSESNAWWMSDAPNPVAGLDEAFVTLVALRAGPPDGLKFVVWSDLPGAVFSGRGEGSVRGASYEGHYRTRDGRHVDFAAKSTDGKTGSLTIAGSIMISRRDFCFWFQRARTRRRLPRSVLTLAGWQKWTRSKSLQSQINRFVNSSRNIKSGMQAANSPICKLIPNG